jgi:chemotaxis protein MotB
MARRKRPSNNSDDSGSWLTTYGDLMTNLLCFFVLLFSMATIDTQKYEQLAKALRASSIGGFSGSGSSFRNNIGKSILTVDFVNPDDTGEKRVDNERYINNAEGVIIDDREKIMYEKIQQSISQLREDIVDLDLTGMVEVVEENEYFLVRFKAEILFESGSAEILENGKNILKTIGESLAPLDNNILVQGHTDTVPINTPLFPSNWELSTKRATNVVMFLIESLGMDPSRLTATGNGEYKPIADNNTVEGRSKNRRIELMIIKNGLLKQTHGL